MATLGNATVGADTFPCSDDRGVVSPYTATEDGTVTEIHYRFDSTSAAGTSFKGIVYGGAGSVPSGASLAVGAATAVPAGGGDVTSTVSFSITNGTKYWIGYVCNGSDCVAEIETSGVASRMEGVTYPSPGTWAEAGTTTEGCGWIVYTPSGGGAALSIAPIIQNYRNMGLMQ